MTPQTSTSIQPAVDIPSLTATRPRGLRSLLQGLARVIDHHPAYAFSLLTLLYAATVTSLSHFKLLWFDEFVTLHIARLGTPRLIWTALAHAADPNPPLAHLAVLASRTLFGEHALALRLPAAAGYWLGMLSLFLFLRRRLAATWALAGTLLSMTNGGFDYSFEARSYGLFYGLTMLALLCWSLTVDSAATRPRRAATLIGMTLALALAVSANYFAVLALVPILCGEFARTSYVAYANRFLPTSPLPPSHARIGCALLLAITPLLAYRPLIAQSVARFAPHAFNKVSLAQIAGSYTEMIEYILYPLLALFLLYATVRTLTGLSEASRSAIRPVWLRHLAQGAAERAAPFPQHEIIATFALLLYPVLGYAMAKSYGGMFSPRLVIPVCLGFAIVGIVAAHRLFSPVRLAGPAILIFLLSWFVAREAFVGYVYVQQRAAFYRTLASLPPSSGSIVISDPLLALPFQHYAPPALAARVVVPIDFSAILFFRGDDSPEENLWAGSGTIYPMPVTSLVSFESRAGDYLILAPETNWLVKLLGGKGACIQRLPIDPHAEDIGGFTPLAHGVPAFFFVRRDVELSSPKCSR